MTAPGEPTAEQREAELSALRRRVRKAARRGQTAEYERLSAEYAAAKAEHVAASLQEHKQAVRARRAAEAQQRAVEGPWKLPRGFGRSPLAQARDRGVRPREEPRGPGPGLRPWRRGGSLMSERVWRP